MAYPDPTQVAPWYLRNINQALELDEATGNVFVRTNAALIGNVTVGNVAIGSLGNVDLSGNSLPVTVESGNVTVFQGTTPWVITGNSNVAITSGNVGITGNIAGITANITNSVVQANNSAVQIGDGTVLYGGVTSSRDTLVVSEDVAARLQLGRQANGTPDTLTLCVGYGNPNADLLWRFGWQEVTN